LHEIAGAFQYREGRMPFIQVTDFRVDAKCSEQAPAADPEKQFLLEAQLRPTPIQLAGDRSITGKVRRIVAVQQVKLDSADLDLK
jgi:hypothetical protein